MRSFCANATLTLEMGNADRFLWQPIRLTVTISPSPSKRRRLGRQAGPMLAHSIEVIRVDIFVACATGMALRRAARKRERTQAISPPRLSGLAVADLGVRREN
jgi:hypothetical protein